ncbi:M48 family metalloprotease [Exilibacterium tricleocarpae]|uniref:M48 family metalloprotease n=1 Tax=Exilibacterium tricleocarpae TaxID=2591008 RepID=UPI001FE4CD32|nr:M48 family metalloprotease [Exilibacterium tricleocarpae]
MRLTFLAKTAALVISALAALSGCTVNPVTGESQFTIMTPAQEVALGEKNYQPYLQSQGGAYVVDPDLSVYVNRIGQKLVKVSDRPGLPYEFVVLNNDVPNAWALPGGKIAINRGLLLHLQDESQLAAVLGHEIVHAAARHGASQATRNVLLQAGAQVVGLATRDTAYGEYAATGASLGAAAWQARYGRDQELEADRFGMEYMARAGYDPAGATELQETFVKLAEGRQSGWLEGLFASHPPSQARVDANRVRAATLPGDKRNRAEFQRAIAQIKKDQPAYEKHQAAFKAAKNKDYPQALTLTEQAIKLQPREAHFWETKGHLLRLQGKKSAAATAYGRAISHNPEYFSPYLARGLVQKSLGKYETAEQDLVRSQQYLGTQTASYHLGELALRNNQRERAIEYFSAAAQGGGELGQAARQQLNTLGISPSSPE